MATLSTMKLTKRLVDGAAPRESRYFQWDCELRGLGLAVGDRRDGSGRCLVNGVPGRTR